MKIILFTMILLLTMTLGYAAVLSVALDGSQPYISIQTAIDASTHADTVLVYPGSYYENVRFNGKNITLASLELITGNRDYMYSTIIDGNQNGPVVRTTTGETNISIRGFTITNGSGDYNAAYDMTVGGGVIASHMTGQRQISIVNCHITGNRATNGGGFWGGGCYLSLSGVSIHNNYASSGGGLYFDGGIALPYNTSYDTSNRCSIYSNYAAFGSDMYYYNVNSVHVVVDTFTVANPWNFYATAIPSNPNISNPYTFDILNTVHQEVNHDLYVAPWGDDANSGINPSEPMQSVFMAMYRIASDSNDPKTVHVANGQYSPSLNGQLFPIPVKSHTRIFGESRDGTIFDADNTSNVIKASAHTQEFSVQNLTLRNGKTGLSASYSNSWLLDNIHILNQYDIRLIRGIRDYGAQGCLTMNDVVISNVESPSATGVFLGFVKGRIVMKNVEVKNCSATERLMAIEIATQAECDILIDGCNIHDNYNNSPDIFNTIFQIAPSESYSTRLRIEMKNSVFYDNYQAMPAHMGNVRALNDTLFIENCTFAGNTGGSATVMVQGTSVLTNNIFHNPAMSTQIWIPNYQSSGIMSHTTLRHNNILGGSSGVYNATSANPLIWGEGNTAYDPLFSYEGNRPYTLSSLSPLIDSGWQYASGLAQPGLDAGGNERVWDGDGDGIAVIDKGAYEYQPVFSPQNLSAELWQQQIILLWEMPGMDRGLSGYRVFRNGLAYTDIFDPGQMMFRDHSPVNDTLVYRVAALYGNVESALSDSVVVIISGVSVTDDLVPAAITLKAAPNPFADIAVIRYSLPRSADVQLRIYNLRGQLVRTLDSGQKSAGEQILAWEGCDDRARSLGSGVYFLRLHVDGALQSQSKLILMK